MTTTYPLVQFVAAADPDAEVRFDFNAAGEWADEDTWPEHEGFSLGAPERVGDPDGYSLDFGLREPTFNLVIRGTYQDASRVWSALATELSRATNWLLFQFSEYAEPMWFKTYAAAGGPLDFEHVLEAEEAAENMWGISVQLDAEAYHYGKRETIPAFVIANDPAAASNPMMVVLPKIKGDGPAPARIEMVPSANHPIPAPMMSITPVPDDFTAPVVIQMGTGDSVTPGTDMDAAASSATVSGGSYRPVTFATTTAMAKRVTLPVAGIRPGRYAVMLRMIRPDDDSTFAFRAVLASRLPGPIVAMDRPYGPGYAQWIDLGTFTLPGGLADPDATAMAPTSIDIQAQRATGTGALWLDAVVLMPVELLPGRPGTRLTTLLDKLGIGPQLARWDGDGEYQQTYSSGVPLGGNPAILARGDFPVLTPGVANVFHLFRQTESAARVDGILGDQRAAIGNGNRDQINLTTTVTISYHPRYYYPAAT